MGAVVAFGVVMIDVGMNTTELERALAGACMIDQCVARMLLTELDEQAFTDPTARLAMWAVRRGLEAEELADDLDVPEGEPPVMTGAAMIVEALDCAGLLDEAGGAEAVKVSTMVCTRLNPVALVPRRA